MLNGAECRVRVPAACAGGVAVAAHLHALQHHELAQIRALRHALRQRLYCCRVVAQVSLVQAPLHGPRQGDDVSGCTIRLRTLQQTQLTSRVGNDDKNN